MPPTNRPARTYSRRQSIKNPTSPGPDFASASGSGTSSGLFDDDDDDGQPRKRRALSRKSSTEDMDGFNNISLSPPKKRTQGRAFIPKVLAEYSSRNLSYTPGTDDSEHIAGEGKNNAVLDKPRDATPGRDDLTISFTPPKKPRDLSRIFEVASPQRRSFVQKGCSSTSSAGPGVTKRMLSRSRTESSLDSSPRRTAQPAQRSQSFATRSRGPNSNQRSQTPGMADTPIASGSQRNKREQVSASRTYAGRSRSFLVALPAPSISTHPGKSRMKQSDDEDDEDYLRDSYSELRRRYGIDNSENDAHVTPDLDNAASTEEGLALYNALSSITDLRSKGESRRFLDEVGYLFEGLEPTGALGVRRSSAFDIIVKLCDQEFWRKAKAAGLLVEIWDSLRSAGAGDGDKVLDSMLCCFVALAAEDARDVSSLSRREGFIETIVRLMVMHGIKDPFLIANANEREISSISKAERSVLQRLRELMTSKTLIVHEGCQPSSRLLLSRVLAAARAEAFPHLSTILDNVAGDLAYVRGRLLAFHSGLSLFSADIEDGIDHEKMCLEHIFNSLVIMDSYLTTEASSNALPLSKADLKERYPMLPSELIALIAVVDIMDRIDVPGFPCSRDSRCSELAFRILINLTNCDASWSKAISTDPYALPLTVRTILASQSLIHRMRSKPSTVDTIAEEASRSIDRLCLALALLTNLLQEQEDLNISLQSIMYDAMCQGRSSCLLSCKCTNSIDAISGIVNLYTSLLKDEDDIMTTELHFLRGHLAALIGLLLIQSQDAGESSGNKFIRYILDSLPKPPDSRRLKLASLIGNIESFSKLYASLADVTTREDRSEDGVSNHQHDPNIVAEVVSSLRSLRDNV